MRYQLWINGTIQNGAGAAYQVSPYQGPEVIGYQGTVAHVENLPNDWSQGVDMEHYVLASVLTPYWDSYSQNARTADGHHLIGPYTDGSFVVWGPGFMDNVFVIPGGSGLGWTDMANQIDNQNMPQSARGPGDGAETGVSADTACNACGGGDGGEL